MTAFVERHLNNARYLVRCEIPMVKTSKTVESRLEVSRTADTTCPSAPSQAKAKEGNTHKRTRTDVW